jgi:hypothetical protein
MRAQVSPKLAVGGKSRKAETQSRAAEVEAKIRKILLKAEDAGVRQASTVCTADDLGIL